jgi:hypothetical protein
MNIIKKYHDKKWTLQFLDALYNSIYYIGSRQIVSNILSFFFLFCFIYFPLDHYQYYPFSLFFISYRQPSSSQFLEYPYSTVKLIVKFYLTIVIWISKMQRLSKIRQLFKFDSPFDKPRQRISKKLITAVPFWQFHSIQRCHS